ncbi:MAG: amidohydrolase [Coriobacteriaceae bacterium]|nr:amidohydrolase [Coriobacteriaceae bacterium]
MLDVIDAHFHVWDLERQDLPWLAGTDGSITHTYTMDDLAAAYAAVPDINFLGGVYVEVDGADPLLEDRLTWRRMSADPRILAAIMRTRIEPWMRLPVFARGVREPLHIDSEAPGRCLEPDFIEGLRVLAAAGRPFESCNRTEDLGLALSAYRQVPEATVVLNHLGNVTPDTFDDDWRRVMTGFAELPNLYLKVSGFPTDDASFVSDVFAFVKGAFRPDRLLYASNWPVVDMYATFKSHVEAVREAFGDDEDFFCNNACACYGIER